MGVRYILWRIVGLQGSYSGLVAAGAIDIDLIFYDVCAMGHEVEVEVVASPVKTKANLSPNVFFVTQAENNNYAYDGSGERPTLTINTSETITLAISTNNSGPFDELGVGFWFSKTGVASAKLVSDQVDYYHISKNAVYFEITAVSSGECVFAITNAATREGIFEISLIVNLD